jgi:hypothetical protein
MLSTILQAATELPNFTGPITGVGLAGIMFWFYREDRKRSEEKLAASEARLATFAIEFRTIVENNTKAMTELSNHLDKS